MNFNWQKIKWGLLGLMTIVTFFVWLVVEQSSAGKFLTVAFLDVGQGDAIFITTPSGRQILFDVGPGRAVLSPLGQTMPFFDHSLDLVLFSHGDADHVGAWTDILTRYDVDYLLAGYWFNAQTDKDNNFMPIKAGTRINFDHDIKLDIIGGGMTNSKNNENSLVARLSYGSTTFLLTGDSMAKEERVEINKLGYYLQADVLKVAHHGSKTSTGAYFLNFVRPHYAVISVGAKNSYGHPTAETLGRLKNIGAEILRTDQEGTIVFQTDGKNLVNKYSN